MGACARYRTGSPIWNAAPRADGTSALSWRRSTVTPPSASARIIRYEAIDRARAALGEDAKYDLDVR